MDRTAGHPGWVVMKPFVTQPSNCIFPDYVVAALIKRSGMAAKAILAFPLAAMPITQASIRSRMALYHYNIGSPYYVIRISRRRSAPALIRRSGIGIIPASIRSPARRAILTPARTHINGVDYGPAPNNGAGLRQESGRQSIAECAAFHRRRSAANTRCRCRRIGRRRCTAISTGNRRASRACSTTGPTTRFEDIRTSTSR